MIAHWNDLEPRLVEAGHLRGRWTDLGAAAGSLAVGVKRIQLAEGDISTPAHVHADEHGPAANLPRAGVSWLFPTWVETGRGDSPWEREIAAGPPDFPEPSEAPDSIVALDDVERLEGGSGAAAEYVVRDLGRAAGSARTGLKLYELLPGKMGPAPHCHSAEEELFVVLEGTGRLVLIKAADTRGTVAVAGFREDHEVRQGHVVSRPPGTRVAPAFVAGDTGLSYLAYGTRDPNDIAFYPRSTKIYFRGVGVMTRLERLDYWEGEDEAL